VALMMLAASRPALALAPDRVRATDRKTGVQALTGTIPIGEVCSGRMTRYSSVIVLGKG
jgi:hypothetical protein